MRSLGSFDVLCRKSHLVSIEKEAWEAVQTEMERRKEYLENME